MNIAIMGAGLAGLACAITLEKEGLEYVIFEKNEQVDDRFVNGEIFLKLLNAPIVDCLAHISEKFGIYIQPSGNIKELVIYSENERAVIKGRLGFNVVRGRNHHSICKQISKQLKKPIIYNSKKSYEELLEEFTHIVLATGDGAHSEKLGNYETHLTVSLNGLIVEGEFDRYTTMTWLDNNFAPQGYCYLIPISEKEANIVVAYPDYPENKNFDSNVLMRNFHQRVQQDLNQTLKEVDSFQITNYKIGKCSSPRIGNTFFVGNCYGAIMPFLGFGQFTAITTGVYAAYDLCGKGNYEELVKELDNSYDNSLVLRRGMETLDNGEFDRIVKNLNGKLGHIIIDSNIDFMKIASTFLKPFIKTNKK